MEPLGYAASPRPLPPQAREGEPDRYAGCSSFLYSRMSPGWQSNALQIASRVENRIALAFPFFRMERFAIVMPTFSESSVTLIFRLASITSILTIMVTSPASYRQVIHGLHVHGLLQGSLENGHRGRNHDRGGGDEDAHEHTARAIIAMAQHDEDFSYRDKADERNRTVPYGSQRSHARWRELLVSSGIPQHLERVIEPHKKRNGAD